MQPDIRNTSVYREAEALYQGFRKPGSGLIFDATELEVSPGGRQAVFVGSLADALEGVPVTRICTVDLETGSTHVYSADSGADRHPKWSRDGKTIAFLSDRVTEGDFQPYLLDLSTSIARPIAKLTGWVEYLHWSPDGEQILFGVAGHGADIAAVQGAVPSRRQERTAESWLPQVESGEEEFRWRQVWIYQVSTGKVIHVECGDYNIWEAAWCGNATLVAIGSAGPTEGDWYEATVSSISIETGERDQLYVPQNQLGQIVGNSSGTRLAFVEAISSDRGVVAGDLKIIDLFRTDAVVAAVTDGVDITHAEWRSDGALLVSGHRGYETVIGLYEHGDRKFKQIWSSRRTSSNGYIRISGIGGHGDCAFVGESFDIPPQILVVQNGIHNSAVSFDTGRPNDLCPRYSIEEVEWTAPDGLNIQGWLLEAPGERPRPLIMYIHGGPVSHWHPIWLGRRNVHIMMLLRRGYSIFFPNPRGSSGRGQDFSRHIVGDLCGVDTDDYLSGIDHLVSRVLADSSRLGVMGTSYGGLMTSWLITQDDRFAAAVPVAAITNFFSGHLLSNIPHFMKMFLGESYTKVGGKYFSRSPIMHAIHVVTPTLNICGALDRCTPAEETVQFHNALREHGVKSVLLNYPEEGHGIRKMPALIDYSARCVLWFEQFLGR